MKGTAMAQIAFIFALFAYPAAGTVLRGATAPSLPGAIAEKWDKMDMFVGEMFKMACTWKHGKDINGLASVKLKNGELEGGKEYREDVKKIQLGNVKGVMKACGMITSTQGKKCRTDCAERWGESANKREACDDKCVLIYKNFEKSCVEQGRNLATIYEQKRQKAAAQMECYTGFCNEFPSVWVKNSEENMNISMNASCNKLCTTDSVQNRCSQKWAKEVSSKTLDIALACNENNSAAFKQCFKDSKTVSSTNYTNCKTNTNSTCTSAFTNCTAEAGPNASKAFCDERKKVCEDQSNAKCLSENNDALAAGKASCTKANHNAVALCKTDTLNTTKTNDMASCMGTRMPACHTGCHDKCKVYEMNQCLAQGQQGDFGVQFCNDFWQMLHASSEVDPVTGDPKFRGRGRAR